MTDALSQEGGRLTYTRRVVGGLWLGATLAFGFYGVVVNAVEGEPARFVQDDVYTEECGACHLAYAPDLLPVQSWDRIMRGLEDHFDENAELDDETAEHLSAYLSEHGLNPGKPSPMSRLLRNLPDEPPLRITELPAFENMHYLVQRQLGVKEFREGFLSPCADCHRQAADGIYDKERLHPGYGPSNWGGPPVSEDSVDEVVAP